MQFHIDSNQGQGNGFADQTPKSKQRKVVGPPPQKEVRSTPV